MQKPIKVDNEDRMLCDKLTLTFWSLNWLNVWRENPAGCIKFKGERIVVKWIVYSQFLFIWILSLSFIQWEVWKIHST